MRGIRQSRSKYEGKAGAGGGVGLSQRKGNEDGGGGGLINGHRYWSVGRHRAQCAVVQSDCPEKNIKWLFKTAT